MVSSRQLNRADRPAAHRPFRWQISVEEHPTNDGAHENRSHADHRQPNPRRKRALRAVRPFFSTVVVRLLHGGIVVRQRLRGHGALELRSQDLDHTQQYFDRCAK